MVFYLVNEYYEYYNCLSKNTIDNEFKKNDIYSKFYQYMKAKFHNPIFVYHKREQFQADVIKFTDPLMMQATKNVANLLVVLDVFEISVALLLSHTTQGCLKLKITLNSRG